MIVAVDFDGILCVNKFPEIGKPNYKIISLIRQLIDRGAEVILWTSRCEKELEAAIEWCDDYGLRFCAINDNAPSNKEYYKEIYKTPPRKIYADIYIDDHDVYFDYMSNHRTYSEALNIIESTLERLVQINERKR